MLTKYRNSIDEIDHEIMELLNKRMMISAAVGVHKKENKIEVLNSKREEEIIEKIKDLDSEYKKEIVNIYLKILEESKNVQR